MAIKDLSIKFYTQPEEGDDIGFRISDSAAEFGLYEFENGESAVDFTYRQSTFRMANGVVGFNNDLTLLSAFNSDSILGGATPGVMRNDDTPGYIYDADSDGNMTLIVGLFDEYNGYSSVNIAGINSRNGMLLNSLGTTTGGIGINAVRFAPGGGGSFYIGGSQTIWGGTSIKQFAKIGASFALDSAFNANVAATGLFDSTTVVTKIETAEAFDGAVFTNKIYVGYTNSTGGGKVVRFNEDGTLDTAFTEVVCTNSTGAGRVYIRALAVDYVDTLYIGGNFEQCNGEDSRMIAKINLSTSPSPPGPSIGDRLPWLTLVGGSNCRAITVEKDTSDTPIAVYLATDAEEIAYHIPFYDPQPDNVIMKGKGLFKAKTGQIGEDSVYLDFLEDIGKGISSENYTVGGIYDIQIVEIYEPEAFVGARRYLMVGGNFRTFAGFRAENIFSFQINTTGTNTPNADFSAPFSMANGMPSFFKMDFPTDYPSIIYRLISSRKKIGGSSSLEEPQNHFLALGRFDATRGMRTTTNYDTTTNTFANNKNIEIGEYKTNTNSITFTIDPSYVDTYGTISIIIGNLYEESENVYYYDGIVIPFTDTGAPGEVEVGPLVVQNLAAFLTDWMEGPGFNPIEPNLLAATRERGLTGPAGIRDFNYNITTTATTVTLEINNPIFNNWFLTSTTFEDPYVVANTGEAISYSSCYADTYWNTWRKLNTEYGTEPYYETNLAAGHYAYDEDFYGSRINLLFDDGGIPEPPIAPREISFIDIDQLLGEIEIYSVQQLLDAAYLALTRSPIVLKSVGTQSSSLFDIYSFIGNIEDPAALSYSTTKQKIASTQTTLFIDIANLVKEDLEADITGFLSDTPVMDLGENESRWVRVRTQNYNGFATGSNSVMSYHVMDGFVSPFELNAAAECIYTFPRILTPHTNIIARGSAPRMYYRNRDVAVMYAISGGFYVVIEPNVFVSQNDLYYNSVDVATYLGANNEVTFGIVYMDEVEEFITYSVYDECKYDKYELIFKNKWGVLESISMTKKTTKQLNVAGDEYLRSIVDINGDYDINRHTRRQFNVDGYEEWTLNTPFIPEYMNESIKQAMLSEEMWIRESGYIQFGELVRTDWAYPVVRLDQSLIYKTGLNDNNIQYTIKVRLSHNEIKNIK